MNDFDLREQLLHSIQDADANDEHELASSLRQSLAGEEYYELMDSMRANDLPGIADAVVDLTYVALGLLVSYGIDPRPIWEAVHRANMAKEGGATRHDGKIMKPQGWAAPDVEGLIAEQIAAGKAA